jgi:RNA polymerase sigma-70 factor (ECF subfamily)
MRSDFTSTLSLVQRAKAGDGAAFTRLFDRYAPRVRGLVALRTGRSLRDFVEHEDIVMEALTDAFAKLDRFEPRSEGSFIGWLAAFVERRVLDTWRRHHAQRRGGGRVRRLADMGDTALLGEVPAAPGPTPTQAFARTELEAALERAMLALSERYRLVVYHRLVLDLPWDSIAEQMQLKDGASARALFHKATARLARLLPAADA